MEVPDKQLEHVLFFRCLGQTREPHIEQDWFAGFSQIEQRPDIIF